MHVVYCCIHMCVHTYMYVLLVCNFRLLRTVLRPHGTYCIGFYRNGFHQRRSCWLLNLLIIINYIAEHVSPRIAGRWDVQGAWCNRYYVEQQAFQRERLRITSFLVWNLLDYVVRTRISIIRRPILMITQWITYVCGNHTTPHNAKKYGFYKLQPCVNMSVNNGGFPCSTVGSPTAQSFTWRKRWTCFGQSQISSYIPSNPFWHNPKPCPPLGDKCKDDMGALTDNNLV